MKVDLDRLKYLPPERWALSTKELLILLFYYDVFEGFSTLIEFVGKGFLNYMNGNGDLTTDHIIKLSELFQLPESTWKP